MRLNSEKMLIGSNPYVKHGENYLLQPDFDTAISFNANTIYKADKDIYIDVCCQSAFNYDFSTITLEISKVSDLSSGVVNLFKSTASGGITWAKGGALFFIPKGYYYRSNANNIRLVMNCLAVEKKIPARYGNALVRKPDYDTGVSVAQNTTNQATQDLWLYSYGGTREIKVSQKSDMSNAVKIAGGVVSATVEPAVMVFISKGLYFTTTGTENRKYNCMEG